MTLSTLSSSPSSLPAVVVHINSRLFPRKRHKVFSGNGVLFASALSFAAEEEDEENRAKNEVRNVRNGRYVWGAHAAMCAECTQIISHVNVYVYMAIINHFSLFYGARRGAHLFRFDERWNA